MKYITLFDTVADFEAAQATLDKPNVSLIEATLGINFLPFDPYNGHAYVEIGGVKWATKNVGASSITDPGLFFHWGDTQGYTAAQCINGDMTQIYKYWDYDEEYGLNTYTDKFNEKYSGHYGTMLSSDDAATAIMGGNWRIPTTAELLSLCNNSNISYTSNYNNTNVPGYIFTDKTDNTKVLFLPATAVKFSSSGYSNFPYADGNKMEYSHYWANGWSDVYGYTLRFYVNDGEVLYDYEAMIPLEVYCGAPIRAVAD